MISLKYYFFSKQYATSSIEESFKLGELRVGLLGWGGGLVFKNLVEEEGHEDFRANVEGDSHLGRHHELFLLLYNLVSNFVHKPVSCLEVNVKSMFDFVKCRFCEKCPLHNAMQDSFMIW